MVVRPLHPRTPSILYDISIYGTMNSTRIRQRHLSHLGKRRCEQILADLVDRGLLYVSELTVLQVHNGRPIPQRQPRLYSCRPAAVEIVEDAFGIGPTRIFQSQPRADLLWHRFHMSETMLAMDESCIAAAHERPTWLLESDQRSNLPKATPPNQRSVLYHRFEDGDRTISLRPDAAFWLDLPQPTNSVISFLVAFETDLSSEGLRQLTRTKPLAYHFWLQRQEFQRYWNRIPDHVRIFWCVPSPRRIASIVKALASHDDILAISRFITQEDRDSKNMLTDPVWWHPTEKAHVAFRV